MKVIIYFYHICHTSSVDGDATTPNYVILLHDLIIEINLPVAEPLRFAQYLDLSVFDHD